MDDLCLIEPDYSRINQLRSLTYMCSECVTDRRCCQHSS